MLTATPSTPLRSQVAMLLLAALAACAQAAGPVETAREGPLRIVSLDYCADQFVLKFAERDRILAISPDATGDFSHMRDAAAGLATVRPRAEDVLALQPDLIVRSYGGGPGATALFARAGIDVLEVGWTPDLGAVQANTLRMATALGAPEAGEALVREMDARLARLATGPADATALYVTPGGVTTGPGGLVGDMLSKAGLENFETRPGWHPLPLERLAREAPDTFVYADFEGGAGPWSAARHPLFLRRLSETDVIRIEGAWTACGGWFLLDAIERLADRDSDG
jgi:iron complex transport system substrate-binding protein